MPTPDFLAGFDVLVWKSNFDAKASIPASFAREALLEHARNGGGWVGIHGPVEALAFRRRGLPERLHPFRIELGEVEHVLRNEVGHEAVACVSWPVSPSGVEGITAFAVGRPEGREAGEDGAKGFKAQVLRRCERRLPAYMVPREIVFVGALPTNTNGKVDRNALVRILRDRGKG